MRYGHLVVTQTQNCAFMPLHPISCSGSPISLDPEANVGRLLCVVRLALSSSETSLAASCRQIASCTSSTVSPFSSHLLITSLLVSLYALPISSLAQPPSLAGTSGVPPAPWLLFRSFRAQPFPLLLLSDSSIL